jgi:hypothetical protein
MTLKRFTERLAARTYDSVTAARRAIGKTDWHVKQKRRARELADQHFEKVELERAFGERPGQAAPKPATHEEFVALAGRANETVEQIRLSAALMLSLRPALAQSTELLLGCLEQAARRMGVTVRGA